jgi:hypothetical protein
MFSLYLHQSIPNCILWGMFQAGLLKTSVQEGNIPQLHLITDLFGSLIPDLPKVYPKKGLQLDIVLTEPPVVQFLGAAGVQLDAKYNTNVTVLNATGDDTSVLVSELTANVTLVASLGWDATTINSTSISYDVLNSSYPVNVKGWNQIIDWVIKQAGPKQSLAQIMDTWVNTPATPYLGLDQTVTSVSDQWFVINSDVKVKELPPIAAALGSRQPAQQQQHREQQQQQQQQWFENEQQHHMPQATEQRWQEEPAAMAVA